MERRAFIKGSLAASIAAGAGFVAPSAMAKWSKEAFEAKTVEDASKVVYGDEAKAEESDKIKLKAPELAENGAVVPVQVTSEIEGTESISVFIKENPVALAATFHFGEGAVASAKTRLKMGKTTDVIAIAKAGDKLYTNKIVVKVTKGGCGG